MNKIKKVAVLGSGIMGSGIAAHLTNAGLDVLLLDMVPKDVADDAPAQERNKLALKALQQAVKTNPAPFFKNSLADKIKVGNFTDDMHRIKDVDWIIEVVVERLDIKKQIFKQVEEHRKEGTLVSSNTSGIPIHMMADGRSDDFKKHFLGTHFFNPPRYLELLEIIPTADTDQQVIDTFMKFGDRILGKQAVLAKDTPAFIANRVGVYTMGHIYTLAEELDLRPNTVDKLTGPALARPKTGTFRLGDLVGLDTAMSVIKGVKDNCPDDKQVQELDVPDFMQYLINEEYYGNKSGQGFYKKLKEKDDKGRSIILELNYETKEYEEQKKEKLKSLETSKQIDDKRNRIKAVYKVDDKGGELIRRSLNALFAYSSNRIPEIADAIYSIDQAMKAGFGWEFGPFEYWDIIGIEEGIKGAEEDGHEVAGWVKKMAENGIESFYTFKDGVRKYYDAESGKHKAIPGTDEIIQLDAFRGNKPVYKNDEVILHDIGDGVLCLEFRSKSNAIGEGILRGIQDAIQMAEDDGWNGLVIGNEASNFTVGANLMLIGMLAFQQEWDELNMAVNMFQQTTMRCRYSRIPVVVATQGYVFGGGCEISMHADSVVASAESYIGLVEFGVGLLPGGGGTKEFAVRTSDAFIKDGIRMPILQKNFSTIAQATVADSALKAFDLNYLNAKDRVIMNKSRNISEAKKRVLELAEDYIMPTERKDVTVMGRAGLGHLYVAANSLLLAGYASEHDIKIARKIAWVMCGGDLTGEQKVSEQYLLNLEREAFLSLCGEQKTLERIQYMLENNKPLRN